MTELHLALLALAAVVLIALYAYNKWQERRALRELEGTLRGNVGDALLDGGAAPAAGATAPAARAALGRIEPQLGLSPADGPVVNHVPATAAGADDGASVTVEPPPAGAEWTEDPLLDLVLELHCAHAADGVAVIDAAVPLANLNLPLPLHLVAWDARGQQWVRPDRFGFYGELLLAIQLAHRRHALDEIEASRFLAAVQQVAVALDADVDAPAASRIVELAQELDRLCSRFDVQVGLTLESTCGPWDAAALATAISNARMSAAGPLSWRRVDDEGRTMFTLTSGSLLADRLVLELDVPRVSPAAEPLRALAAAANQLAAALGARVVDDHGRPIDSAALAAIETQLAGLYGEMAAAGIEPGSPRALRLYV